MCTIHNMSIVVNQLFGYIMIAHLVDQAWVFQSYIFPLER